MTYPTLKIGDLTPRLPLIQGGMGIGVSMERLAAAVASAGGIGVISGAQPGYREPDFRTNHREANRRGLVKAIRAARELCPDGILGVNLLQATKHYEELVRTAVEEKIDLIITGAGLPKKLPELVAGSTTKIIPIVSSKKALALIEKLWTKRYDRKPDAVIFEGPEAGGHLGFSASDLAGTIDTDALLTEVVTHADGRYPIIAAGGYHTPEKIQHAFALGARGVQVSTPFVTTVECDADIAYKEAYLSARAEDIVIVNSPLGMPGRALKNPFIARTFQGKIPIKSCYQCIEKCNPADTPYCITEALVAAVEGRVDEGLIFMGEGASDLHELTDVATVIQRLFP